MKEIHHRKKKVFVGLSGGVDSSVSAALLKKEGYEVIGVFIKTWQPDFIEPARMTRSGGCTWRDERRDAMRVAAHLDIPFVTLDLEREYKEGVADYMIAEYKAGKTPNPDVMCNREVKFGAFWKWARVHGADYIATGHYARISQRSKVKSQKSKTIRGGPLSTFDFRLSTGTDLSKDQSYFLWTLTQDDLAHTLFPVGHLKKEQVRKLAEKLGLPTALKKDSQGVCFLGPLDMRDFLAHYIQSKKGNVLDVSGKIIGHHDGAPFFTLGERHGFTITKKTSSDKPYFVVEKDIKKNTITVSHNFFSLKVEKFYSNVLEPARHSNNNGNNYSNVLTNIRIEKTNWIHNLPEERKKYHAEIRYHGELLSCRIKIDSKSTARVYFDKPELVSPGQSIVVYDESTCIGGGTVV